MAISPLIKRAYTRATGSPTPWPSRDPPKLPEKVYVGVGGVKPVWKNRRALPNSFEGRPGPKRSKSHKFKQISKNKNDKILITKRGDGV
jgi:hypothetical protein